MYINKLINMKSKIEYKLIILICIIFAIFLLSSGLFSDFKEFNDLGTNSNFNPNWVTTDMFVTRNNNYTTLSNNMDSSQDYIAKKTIDSECIIEWNSYGEPNTLDYCIISDSKNTKSNIINFVDNLGITGDSHIKLVITNDEIIPYVNNVAKEPIKLSSSLSQGLYFHFQINPNGANISYSDFTIHK